MPYINSVVEHWRAEVDFVVVYIEEAHASDEWPIYQVDSIDQHKSTDARIQAALKYQNEIACHAQLPFVVDTLQNDFNREFASWPFRFWVLHRCDDGQVRVVFKAMPKQSAYRLEDLADFLTSESPLLSSSQ